MLYGPAIYNQTVSFYGAIVIVHMLAADGTPYTSRIRARQAAYKNISLSRPFDGENLRNDLRPHIQWQIVPGF